MPYLRHIVAPQLNQEVDKIRAELGDGNVQSPMGAFLNGARLGAAEEARRQKGTRLLPNAPVPAQPEPKPNARGMIPLPPAGEAVGVDETGQAIDRYGKRLGYLQQPAVVTPYGDMPMRTALRTPEDIKATLGMGLRTGQPEAEAMLRYLYGSAAKEKQDNRDANGMPTDQFPPGFFDNMTPEQKKNIKLGVQKLMALDRGTRT